ncbi:hypothetical protein [Roseiconus lacunae]|uniref:Uncharacterized protein n=1 Tax=Roseiconus lacunae TaxID=2605694 RepID=A0ABT7PH52_9BACT|nr:hypothetical protein [Roseiconus lacunae]MDM4015840.1 hypothetical protein [Roseiconus lacunae]
MSSLAERFDAKLESALAAHEQGDIAGAIRFMRQAKILIVGIPDSKLEEESIAFRPGELDAAIKELKVELNESTASETVGMVMVPHKPTNG